VKFDYLETKECRNNLSARSQNDIVSDLINKELDNGFVYGPFCKLPFEKYRVGPLGVAEGNYSQKKRLIQDLAAPHNDNVVSVNEDDLCAMSYFKIDNAIKIITKYGKGTMLCKFDIQNAFKIWPAFLSIDPPNFDDERTMSLMTMIFRRLSIPIAKHKTMDPLTCIKYLGIILDGKKLEARLRQGKIDRICNFINSVLQKSSCTKWELLELLGHLLLCLAEHSFPTSYK
jgi:hypothetical protein